jgi:hypothetical protein
MVYHTIVEVNRLKIFIINYLSLTKCSPGKTGVRVLEIPSVAWDRMYAGV